MSQIKKPGGLDEEVLEYVLEVNGILVLGSETDPHVTELFLEGEEVTLGLAEDGIQVFSAAKTS